MGRDHLVHALLPGGDLRLLVAHTAGVSREAARLHGCAATTATLLAHTVTGAVLMGGLGKGEQRVTLQLEGPGPVGGLFAEASAEGGVRAYVRHPSVNFPGRDGGDLHMSLGGDGYLSVLRDLPGGDLYRGVVALEAAALDVALESYFAASEQVLTTVAIDVQVGPDGIESATGLLVQRLPGGDAAVLERIRERLRAGALQRSLLEGDRSGLRVAEAALAGLGDLELLEDVPLAYRCPCTRERALRGVVAAGREEILDMVARDQGAELVCEFCRTPYRFEAAELLELLDRMESPTD